MHVRVSASRTGERDPSALIAAMNYQSGRLLLLVIDQQDNQLAIAGVGTVMRARAVLMGDACHLQIKGLDQAEAGGGKLLANPGLYDLAWLL